RSAGEPQVRALTFDGLLRDTGLVNDLRQMLQTLETAYDYPVDIEFTANFIGQGQYRINLLQCRPLQVQGTTKVEMPDTHVDQEDLIIAARGAVIGQSLLTSVDRFIYVSPNLYGRLPLQARYEVARLLGTINHAGGEQIGKVMMLGPGRWGTTSPHLGLPVTFSDINHVSILCEIVAMHENLVPDVSLGTHFLNEIVERNILYLALFPKQGDNFLSLDFFENSPSRLLELVPSAENMEGVVRVIDSASVVNNASIRIAADAVEQKVLCYRERRS
ncbi:MAG: pyruvate, phosphate dikinase, partial [Thermoleophilia bacterium]|nr:pyruvate, phosphate dikinase [Thermoleophilia bacterium]